MWVTSLRREGPLWICHGWVIRYPTAPTAAENPIAVAQPGMHPPPGADDLAGIGTRHPYSILPPIVEPNASTICSKGALVPFAASPTASP
jgi:hypothetical protein